MFQDSNKEYTGSSAGVAGNNPATPVSLSAAQEASVQAATLAALQQLKQRRAIANVEATQAQLYELARQTMVTQQGSLDVAKLVDQWQQNTRVTAAQTAPGFTSPVAPRGEASPVNAQHDNNSLRQSGTNVKTESSSVTASPVVGAANATSIEDISGQSSEELVDGGNAENQNSDGVSIEAERSGSETKAETMDINESGAPNFQQVASGSEQPSSATQSAPSSSLVDNQTKGVSDQAPVPSQVADTASPTQEPDAGSPAAGSETPAPTAPTSDQSFGNGKEGGGGAPSPAVRPGEAHQLHGEPGDPRYKREGLPTARRDRFKRGLEDRKSGESFKNAYSARKLPSGGSAVKGLGEGAAKGAAKGVAQEGAKDVAKAVAKEGTKDAVKAGAKFVPGADVASDIDLKGAIQSAKDLKDLKVGAAAKDAAKSITVTLFRVSYDPWVIGFTVGLSLIVTLLVGSFLFFVPSSSISFLERLLVVALWLLLGLAVLLILGLLLVGLCNGPQGLAIWGASFFSKTAADINKFCEPIGVLQAATKNIAR